MEINPVRKVSQSNCADKTGSKHVEVWNTTLFSLQKNQFKMYQISKPLANTSNYQGKTFRELFKTPSQANTSWRTSQKHRQ